MPTYKVYSCPCRWGTDPRGTTITFFDRDDEGRIRCAECGETPEALATPTNPRYPVELIITHKVGPGMSRRYMQFIYPDREDAPAEHLPKL